MDIGRAIDRAIATFFPNWGAQRAVDRLKFEAATMYRGASRDRTRSDWSTGRQDPDPASYELDALRNRSREMNTMDGVASGATETMSINIAGNGLQLQSRIRAEDLGISEEQVEKIRRQAEDLWTRFNVFADIGRRLTFDEIQYLAIRKVIEDGESVIIPTWLDDPLQPLARRLQIIEADRIAATDREFQYGIKLGAHGEPMQYSIRKAGSYSQYDVIDARDEAGRPKILHIYRPLRPGQIRGVPLLSPVLALFKDVAETREAWVMKERIQACLAMVLTKKTDPIQEAMRNATDTEVSTKTASTRLQQMEPGMIYYNEEGDEVSLLDPGRSAEGFEPFFRSTIRMICAALGIPYELVMKDFSQTNYSSARAALLEGRRVFTHWRKWLATKLCQPVYEMVLEEAFLRGLFDAPNFQERKWAYCRAAWIGGGWGWVDPVKEIEASKMAIDYHLSTGADEAASAGKDYEENVRQNAREKKLREDVGLNDVQPKANPDAETDKPEQPEQQARRQAVVAAMIKEPTV